MNSFDHLWSQISNKLVVLIDRLEGIISQSDLQELQSRFNKDSSKIYLYKQEVYELIKTKGNQKHEQIMEQPKQITVSDINDSDNDSIDTYIGNEIDISELYNYDSDDTIYEKDLEQEKQFDLPTILNELDTIHSKINQQFHHHELKIRHLLENSRQLSLMIDDMTMESLILEHRVQSIQKTLKLIHPIAFSTVWWLTIMLYMIIK